MPVVINEFEVVPQPPSSNTSADSGESGSSGKPAGLSPRDVEKIVERERERLLRVWAH